MYQASDKISKLVSGIVQEAIDNNTLNPNLNPTQLTMMLWGVTIGIVQLIKVKGLKIKDKMNIDEADIIDTFLKFLENGMKK
jgi:hypothetical protein